MGVQQSYSIYRSPEFPWQEERTAFATKEETDTEEVEKVVKTKAKGETRCHDAFFLTSRKWLKKKITSLYNL
ncbi:hypothetical protein QVD17_21836 [Tagetes erecta]|uniref:Uncharacterized protein n=1 Tax=Tagetes erecta TaxID=13708 RepID=A0AAD8KFX8_TARER|nr:hypothetical protein QVD17_21836 [Tagetes erecta]